MPKYRKLYTKIVESFDFNDMPDDFHRLFWTLLPLVASREGTLPYHPTLILSKVFPMRRDVEAKQVEDALNWFAAHDMIRYYEASGRRYIWIVNFAEYQGVTEKEAASEYPPVTESVKTYSGPTPDLLQNKSRLDSDADADADADSDSDVDVVARKNDDDNGAAPEPELDADTSRAVKAWEQANGRLLTPGDAQQIMSMVKEYPAGWVTDAIWEANKSKNGRQMNLAFVDAFLRRWQTEGYKAPRDSPKAEDSARKRELAQQTRKELLREGIPRERVDAAIREQFGEGF